MRVLLIALALLLAAPATAAACKCVVPGDASKEIAEADAVAWAKVVKRTVLGPESVRYKLAVKVDYKGNLPETFKLTTSRSSASCGIDVARGDKLGMLLTLLDGGYSTSSCQLRSRRHLDGGTGARAAAGDCA